MSQRCDWQQFVERRRVQLHDTYPCSRPTHRGTCPKHRARIGRTSRICKPCRDELYQQLAAEYVNAERDGDGQNHGLLDAVNAKRRAKRTPTEADRPPLRPFPGSKPPAVPGQLTLDDIDTHPGKEHNVSTHTEIIEGEVLADVIDHTLAPPITLFGTSDPRVALDRMADVASALVDVIDTKKLYATINGRKHIIVEGWTTLGAMLGVVAVVTGTRQNDNGDGIVATVEARTLDGRVVGAAEGECSRVEQRWKSRDPYAIRSMAQTRAISRALRAPLGQIIVLAGYDATPLEEMPVDEPTVEPRGKIPPEDRPTPEQVTMLTELLGKLRELDPDTDWAAEARKAAGVPSWDYVTKTIAERVLQALRARRSGPS
jgi:hypothetical protein